MSDSGSSLSDLDYSSFNNILVINKYLLVKEIGYGACSSVWLSYNIDDHNFCAIKINNPEGDDYTKTEISMGKLLRTKIPSKSFMSAPYDSFFVANDGEDYYCTVFKLYGGSMLNVIQSPLYSKGLPFMLALHFLKQLLHALDILHNEFAYLHTDIRPDNILISDLPKEYLDYMARYVLEMRRFAEGLPISNNKIYESLSAKIAEKLGDGQISSSSSKGYNYSLSSESYCVLHDFGMMREDDGEPHKVGAFDFRAPEVLLELASGRGCDVWALGCTFYEMLTGKELFSSEKFPEDSPYDERIEMLSEMFALCGYLPTSLIKDSPLQKDFFIKQRNKYLLVKDYECPRKPISMEELLKENIATKLSKRSMDLLLSIFNKLLHIDPQVRDKLNYRSMIAQIDGFLRSHKFYER